MIRTAELDTSHIVELGLATEIQSYMADNGYPTTVELEETYAVVSESDTGYIVFKVETLSKPLDVADAVEDKTHVWLCTCSDMRYRQTPDLAEQSAEQIGHCKHVEACRKEIRAQNDENQSTL